VVCVWDAWISRWYWESRKARSAVYKRLIFPTLRAQQHSRICSKRRTNVQSSTGNHSINPTHHPVHTPHTMKIKSVHKWKVKFVIPEGWGTKGPPAHAFLVQKLKKYHVKMNEIRRNADFPMYLKYMLGMLLRSAQQSDRRFRKVSASSLLVIEGMSPKLP
jgi:hypothetical protein